MGLPVVLCTNSTGVQHMKRFVLYLLRWQLSTPILAMVIAWLAYLGEWKAAAIANLIGGTIFFWVDRWIFKS